VWDIEKGEELLALSGTTCATVAAVGLPRDDERPPPESDSRTTASWVAAAAATVGPLKRDLMMDSDLPAQKRAAEEQRRLAEAILAAVPDLTPMWSPLYINGFQQDRLY
jgi:hypothetical protein